MILYLDERMCVTTRDKAVHVLFGVPDWVAGDIMEYGTRYCCGYVYERGNVKWNIIRCEGMGGARNFTVDTYLCFDARGREFVLNRDDVANIVRPLVCMARRLSTRLSIETNYRYMLNIAEKVRCRGYCVVDEEGEVVVFGDDLFDVLDAWVKLMRSRNITTWSVLV
jgi:hypothetical protein